MTAQTRLGVVLVVLFLGILGFWWWSLEDYRSTAAIVNRLEGDVRKLQEHVKETERVLAAVDSLKESIRSARSEANEALEESRCYIGVERLDRLERLLQQDYARRSGGSAPDGAAR